MHHVVALALPGVVAFDLAIPAQVFGHEDERERYSFRVCAAEPGLVPTTSGYSIYADAGLEALAAADTVVVPGFSPLDDPTAAVCEALRQAAANGARVVSVCTGAFALAAAGLLDGKRATTHWRNAKSLQALHPAVTVDPCISTRARSAPARGWRPASTCASIWSAKTMEPRPPSALPGAWSWHPIARVAKPNSSNAPLPLR